MISKITNNQPMFLAYAICQRLSSIWVPNQMQWDSRSLQWKYTEANRGRSLKCTTTFLVFHIVTCLFAIHACFEKPELGTLTRLMALGGQIFLLSNLILGDVLNYLYAEEVLAALNWCHGTHDKILQFGNKKMEEKFAFAIVTSVIGLNIDSAMVTGGILFYKLDPFYVSLRCWHGDSEWTPLWDIGRWLYFFAVGQFGIISIRLLVTTFAVQAVYRAKILKELLVWSVTPDLLTVYKESQLISRIMHEFEYVGSTFVLGGTFWTVVVATNVCILGRRLQVPIVTEIAMTAMVTGVALVHLVLACGCLYYEYSERILSRWKEQAGYMDRKSCLPRVVKSLPKIWWPAGSVGRIDMEIKIRFTERTQATVIDSILGIDAILES